jgi:phage shock protein A
MGIFKRIKTIVRGQANGFLNQVEQPIHMLNQYIREAEMDLVKGQQALANQIYLEKKQGVLLSQTKETLTKRERQAKLAVERGEEEIAKIAIKEKLIQEEKLTAYEMQYHAIQEQSANLQDQLKLLQEKLDDFNHRKLILISKLNVTSSLKGMNDTFVSFNTENIANGFARVEERLLLLESELEARKQLRPSYTQPKAVELDPSIQEKVEREFEKFKRDAVESA